MPDGENSCSRVRGAAWLRRDSSVGAPSNDPARVVLAGLAVAERNGAG